jgi:hypothetical protein
MIEPSSPLCLCGLLGTSPRGAYAHGAARSLFLTMESDGTEALEHHSGPNHEARLAGVVHNADVSARRF